MQVLPRSASRWSVKSLSSTSLGSRVPFICTACQSTPQHLRPQIPSQRQRHNFAFRSLAEKSPQIAPPPPSGHARLNTRRLISISGIDAPHFLQGLITTSIEGNSGARANDTAKPTEQTPWSYCLFLNALGRILHDVFIYPVPHGSGGEPHFMIEVDAVEMSALLNHLKRFKLRSKIFLRAIEEDEMSVWQVWDDGNPTPVTATSGFARVNERSVILPDLRAPGMGHRVLTVGADLDVQTLDFSSKAATEKVDEAAYRVRRYLRGVPEGGAEIISLEALPQESNMDIMGAIDFRKGCYVGQELTIRTRHRGVVRKRILPCVLYGENEAPPATLEYVPGSDRDDLRGLTIGRSGKSGRSPGTFLGGVGNVGLALCRVQLMSDLVVPNDTATLEFDPAAEFVVKTDEGKIVKVKAFVPEWLRQRLGEDAVKHTQ
ncbi:Aminomethyltransferase folate-binding domain-containing protein [Xylaria nigripes]|nr:Aminomethyltransferase folate-binding domain-containing protein [Xylaria nigripes]